MYGICIYVYYIYRYSAYTCKQKCIKHIAMTAMGAVLFAGPEAGAYLPSQLLNNFEARLSRITAHLAGVLLMQGKCALWTPDRETTASWMLLGSGVQVG